ncbi:hypothetical protein RRF57_009335 [Xylaria bambusicola]|uniref:Uncharacterized protein n=1 Tax=Xylaria bambusicola TaxID=326684 RepID=A0AAN7ZBW9_9PEZI
MDIPLLSPWESIFKLSPYDGVRPPEKVHGRHDAGDFDDRQDKDVAVRYASLVVMEPSIQDYEEAPTSKVYLQDKQYTPNKDGFELGPSRSGPPIEQPEKNRNSNDVTDKPNGHKNTLQHGC